MAYYTDTCNGRLIEYAHDELDDAKEAVENELQKARDFEARMGFRPFYADAMEIRRGKPELGYDLPGESGNKNIVDNTTIFRRYHI